MTTQASSSPLLAGNERGAQPARFSPHLTEATLARRIADLTSAFAGFDLRRDPIDNGAGSALPELAFDLHPGMQEAVADQSFRALTLERRQEPQLRDPQAGSGVSKVDDFAVAISAEPELLTCRDGSQGQGRNSGVLDGLTSAPARRAAPHAGSDRPVGAAAAAHEPPQGDP